MSQLPARLDAAQRELALVETPDDAKELYDKLETLSQYAKRYDADNEQQNEIGRLKLHTVRKGGALLSQTVGHSGGSPSRRARDLPVGFTWSMSSRWQAVARLDDEGFAEVLAAPEVTLQRALARAGRGERDRRIRRERERAMAAARKTIAELGAAEACQVYPGDIASWRPEGPVACVITDPPYITDDAVELHSKLADFALDVLPPHGALAVMTWQPLLPAVLEAMRRDRLVYRWTAAWVYATSERTPERTPRVFDGWKPILIFHKDGWIEDSTYLYDVIRSRDADKESHEWGQSIAGFRQLVRALSVPGDVVCDPFVGGGTTPVAALAEARMFVGCDIDPSAVETTNGRIAP